MSLKTAGKSSRAPARQSLPANGMNPPSTPTSLTHARGAKTSPRQPYKFDALAQATELHRTQPSHDAHALLDIDTTMDEFLDDDAFRSDLPAAEATLPGTEDVGTRIEVAESVSAQPSFAETDRDPDESVVEQISRPLAPNTQTPSILPQKRPIDALQSAIHFNASTDAVGESPLIRRPAGLSSAKLRDATSEQPNIDLARATTPEREMNPLAEAIQTPANQILESSFAVSQQGTANKSDAEPEVMPAAGAAPQTPKQVKARTTMDPAEHDGAIGEEVWAADQLDGSRREQARRSPTPPSTALLPGFDEAADSDEAGSVGDVEETSAVVAAGDDTGSVSVQDEEYDSWDEEVDRDEEVRAEAARRASKIELPPPSTPPSAARIAMDIPLSRDKLALEIFEGEEHLLLRPPPTTRATTPPSATRVAMDIPLSRGSEAFESWADKAPQAAMSPPKSILKGSPERPARSTAVPATESRVAKRTIPQADLGKQRRARFSLDAVPGDLQVGDELQPPRQRSTRAAKKPTPVQEEVPASEESAPENDGIVDAPPSTRRSSNRKAQNARQRDADAAATPTRPTRKARQTPTRAPITAESVDELTPSIASAGQRRVSGTRKSISPQKAFKVVATPRSSKLRALSQYLARQETSSSPALPAIADDSSDEELPELGVQTQTEDTPGAQARRDLSDDIDLDELVTPSKSSPPSARKTSGKGTPQSATSGSASARKNRRRADAIATPVFSLRPRRVVVDDDLPSTPPRPASAQQLGDDAGFEEDHGPGGYDVDQDEAALPMPDYDEPVEDASPVGRPAMDRRRRQSASHTPNPQRFLNQLKTFGKTPERLPRSRRQRHKPGAWWTTGVAEAGEQHGATVSKQTVAKSFEKVGSKRRRAAISPQPSGEVDHEGNSGTRPAAKRAKLGATSQRAKPIANGASAAPSPPVRKRPSELQGPVSSNYKVRMASSAGKSSPLQTPTAISKTNSLGKRPIVEVTPVSAASRNPSSGLKKRGTPVSPASKRKLQFRGDDLPNSTSKSADKKGKGKGKLFSTPALPPPSATRVTPTSRGKGKRSSGARLSDVRSFNFEDDLDF